MDYYKRFIKDEYNWVYDDCTDSSKQLLEEFESDITLEEFEDNFDLFMEVSTNRFINDDYFIQEFHDGMHDELRNVLSQYAEDKEKFINSYKPNDITVRNEIEEEIVSCYKILNYYGITEEVLIKNELIDKEKIELLKEIGKLTDNEKEIESIDISFNYTDGTEYKYKFTKNKEKESTAPSWLRDVVK